MLNLVVSNARFRALLFAQFFLNIGEAASGFIVPLVVLKITGSPTLLSLIVILEMVPYFAFHLPFGALLDRWDRKRSMVLADLGRALLVLVVVVVHFLGGSALTALFIIAIPFGILSSISDAARSAVAPQLVKRSELDSAYAWTESGESVAWVAGPAVAGLVVVAIGAIEALSLVSAALLVFPISIGFINISRLPTTDIGKKSLFIDVKEGLMFFWRNSQLRTMQFMWTAYGAIGYGVVIGLVYVGSGGDASHTMAASWAVSAYALGSVIGTACAGYLRLRSGLVPAACLAVFSMGAVLISQGSLSYMLVGATLVGAGEGFLLVIYLATRASLSAGHFMGRVVSAAALLDKGAGMLAVMWIGASLSLVGGSATFLIVGGFGILLVVVGLSLRRVLERNGDPPVG